MFIEIHEVKTNKPGLLNVDLITSIIPAQTKDQCLILCNGSGKWLNVTESYVDVCKKLNYCGLVFTDGDVDA